MLTLVRPWCWDDGPHEVSSVSSQALNEAQELAPMADELLKVESAEAQASF